MTRLMPTNRGSARAVSKHSSVGAKSFGLVDARLGECHVVAQSARQQFLAQLTEIVVPADFSRDCSGVTEIRRVHQLEVLFILCVSASSDLIDPLAEMAMIGPAEFREGIEEVIVPRHSRRGHETAHGESIHERVKEMLVFVSAFRRDSVVSAHGLVRSAASRGLRLRESKLGNIDAQMIFGCRANPGFRVNSAAQMIVKIGALRHAKKEVTKLKRILPRGLESELGALFGTCRHGRRMRSFGLGQSRRGEEQQKNQNAGRSGETEASRKTYFRVVHKDFFQEIAA